MPDALQRGRMIAPSKSTYYTSHPDHVVVFNANIFTGKRMRIWYGDLDITVDGDALKAMAAEQGEELYVLREYDDKNPVLDAAVARVTADTVTIC